MRGERICDNDCRFKSHQNHNFFYVSRTFGGKFKHEEKHKDKALKKILLSLSRSTDFYGIQISRHTYSAILKENKLHAVTRTVTKLELRQEI